MTRKSKREVERALADLADGVAIPADESYAKQHYTDSVRSLVYQTCRDVLRLTRDPEIANSTEPVRGLLSKVREVYGIDEDQDEAVLATLDDRLQETESVHPRDVFASAVVAGPRLLDERAYARFDSALEAGRDNVAARLVVQAVYEWLAHQDGGRAEVPA